MSDQERQCPACQTHQPETARYCSTCGSPLPPSGASGAEASPGKHHTPLLRRLIPHQYAERLSAGHGAPRSERRIVTTLFADIVDSTALAEKLDPEDVTEIVNGAFRILTEPVQRHDGTLARLMGDAILGLFGAPIAHEDDPARACRAAADILRGTEEYAAELQERFGINFQIRVGISTGLAVVGEVGTETRSEYTAIGDAVNLAARLQSHAPPGGVFIDARTRERTASVFDAEDRGDFQFKGKSEPVRVYQLRLDATVSPPGNAVVATAQFFNRETERELLADVLRACAAGRGRFVSINGDAGIGKTRLLAEARKDAGELLWIEGRCHSHTQEDGFWVVRDLLQSLLEFEADRHPTGRAASVRDLLGDPDTRQPADSGVSAPLTRLLSLEPDEEEERVLAALSASQLQAGIGASFCECVRRVCAHTPVVMVWEDIHWIDPQSRDVLSALGAQTASMPLVVLSVMRTEGPPGGGSEEVSKAPPGNGDVSIRLRPLTLDVGASMVDHLTEQCPVTTATRDRILTIADGNPLCIEEMTRSVCAGRSASGSEPVHVDVPVTVQAAILARADRLPPRERNVLRTAVVIGKSFYPDILERVLNPRLKKDDLVESLATLEAQGFIDSSRPAEQKSRERPEFGSAVRLVSQSVLLSRTSLGLASSMAPPPFTFRHALVVEVIYQSLLKSERRDIHGRVGAMLEAIYANYRRQLAPVLLYHFTKGEVRDKALEYLMMAADHAFDLYALPRATGCYERALASLADQSEEESRAVHAHAHTRLGDIHRMRGEYAPALERYQDALSSAPTAAARADVHYRIGRVYQRSGRWDQAQRAYGDGLAAVGRDTEQKAYVRLCLGLSSVHCHRGHFDESIRLGELALSQAQRADDRHGVALAHSNLGSVYAKRGESEPAVAAYKQARFLLEQLGDQHGLAVLHNNMGCLHKDLEQWDDARRHLTKSLELFTQLNNEHAQARVHDNLGDVAYLSGQEEVAQVHLERAMEILARIGADSSGPVPEMWQSGTW